MKKNDGMTKTLLMAIRCEFIEGITLTKKGKGLLPPKYWRLYNRIQCFFSKKKQIRMVHLLKYIDKTNEKLPVTK